MSVTAWLHYYHVSKGEEVRAHWLAVGPLEAIRLVAYDNGFTDVDAEPTVSGWKVTLTGLSRTLTANGATQEDAVEKLLKILDEPA